MSYQLVFGASGYIGGHLVPYLAQHGAKVRATARNVEVLQSREWQGVQLAEADALKPETLDAVLEDVDTAFYLVHSMASGRDYASRDRQAAESFRDAAATAGVPFVAYRNRTLLTQYHIESLKDLEELLEV